MNEDLLTREELAVRLNISAYCIDKLRKYENMPYVKLRGSYRYNLTQIKDFFKELSIRQTKTSEGK